MSEEAETQEPVPGSDEYNEQMAARYRASKEEPGDEATTEQVPVNPMPEGGYEKFYNKDTGEYDWANHAKELQYRLDQATKGAEKQEESAPEKTEEEQEAADIISRAGLKQEDLESTIKSEGALNDDQIAALEAQGLPRSLIDSYVESYKIAQQATANAGLDYVGGQEAWNEINAWATDNLSGSEKDLYNQMLKGPNWQVAVDALKQKMRDASPTGGEGHLETGGQAAVSTTGYRSKAEMTRDMNMPEYKNDPAFRAKVMQKIANASWDLD